MPQPQSEPRSPQLPALSRLRSTPLRLANARARCSTHVGPWRATSGPPVGRSVTENMVAHPFRQAHCQTTYSCAVGGTYFRGWSLLSRPDPPCLRRGLVGGAGGSGPLPARTLPPLVLSTSIGRVRESTGVKQLVGADRHSTRGISPRSLPISKTLSENFSMNLEQRRISPRMSLPIVTVLKGDAPYEKGYHNE
jgi:hypothetical protein